jgi:uncharacterized protein (DUF1330 family)
MSAYLIFMRGKTLDEHELATYSNELPATLAGHEVKVLALHGSHEELEGASTARQIANHESPRTTELYEQQINN